MSHDLKHQGLNVAVVKGPAWHWGQPPQRGEGGKRLLRGEPVPLGLAGGGQRRARCRLPAFTGVPCSRGTGSWGVAVRGGSPEERVELRDRSGTGRRRSGVRRR